MYYGVYSTVHKGLILRLNRKASFFLAAPRTGSLVLDGLENRSHFFYYDKMWNGKIFPFANLKKICDLRRQLQKKIQACNLRTGWYISYKSVKQFRLNFPDQIAKHFRICKWISFTISTFVMIEEMASECRVLVKVDRLAKFQV